MVKNQKSFNRFFLIFIGVIFYFLHSVCFAKPIQIDLWNKAYKNHKYLDLIQIDSEIDHLKITANNVCVPVVFEIPKVSLGQNTTVQWDWKIKSSNYDLDTTADSFASVSFVAKTGILRYNILRYVWVASRDPIGTIIKSPYSNRTYWIVLQNTSSPKETWVSERINLYDDFMKTFGWSPTSIVAISVFPDSNQTSEKFVSYYGSIFFH